MYNTSSYANRATNQMQGAAGTLASMTKKQEVKVKRPDTTAGDIISQGIGLTMVGNELSEADWVKSLFQDDPVKDATSKVAETSSGVDSMPLAEEVVTDVISPGTHTPDLAPAVGYPPRVMAPPNTGAPIPPTPPGVNATPAPTAPTSTLPKAMGAPTSTPSTAPMAKAMGSAPAATPVAPKVMAETGVQAANTGGSIASTTGGASVGSQVAGMTGAEVTAATDSLASSLAGGSAISGVAVPGASIGSEVAAMTGAEAAAAADTLAASITTAELGTAAGTGATVGGEMAAAGGAAAASNPAGWIVGGIAAVGILGATLFS